ncbi:Riboflavin-binding protein RibY [bacterium HR32]|jgi:NitT/TauT family transport system substrate-binding protein|nr:Riboflavin-binding protein RibY [bacterium HR32]
MRLRWWSLLFVVLLAGWPAAAQGVKVAVIESWFIHNESMGDPIAVERGFYGDLRVEVIGGGPGLSPIDRTMAKARAGEIVFGVDYPQNILEARERQRLPLVVVGHDFQKSAMRIVCWSPKRTAGDFRGRFATWIGYDKPIKAVVGRNWQRQIQVVNQQGDPATLGGWLAKQYDCASAMIYNELLVIQRLAREGRIKDRYYVYSYPQFGVDWPENVLFTTEEIVAKHPQVVQRFVTARYRGFAWGFANREAAADILLKYNKNLDRRHEIEGMEAIHSIMVTPYTRQHGLGAVDPAAWDRLGRDLVRAGFYAQTPNVRAAYTTRFRSGVRP